MLSFTMPTSKRISPLILSIAFGLLSIIVAAAILQGGGDVLFGQLFAAVGKPPQSLTVRPGTYQLVGYNPGSTTVEYTGAVTIRKQGPVYHLSWTIEGRQTHLGTGILTSNILSVSYDDLEGNSGVVAYRVKRDGSLAGFWAPADGSQLGREILSWRFP